MKKLILALLSVASLIFVIGSACAWDNGNIGIFQCIMQCAMGVCVEWFALKKMDI